MTYTNIFISYAWEDKHFAQRLENILKAAGADVWIDHSSLRGGDNLPDSIIIALKHCAAVIVIWSEAASKSHWVHMELITAYNYQKKVIPCVLDNSSLPNFLSSVVYIDFREFDKGIAQLFYALQSKQSRSMNENIENNTTTNTKTDTAKYRDNILSNIRNRNFQTAIIEARKNMAAYPDDTFLNLALGVALSNGKSLMELAYPIAKEMHHNFSIAYDNPETRPVAIVALVALKLDYFKRNSVTDYFPFMDELLPRLSSISLSSRDRDIVVRLRMSDKVRALLGF